MRFNGFNRELYDRCCDDHPRFAKAGAKWQAVCMSCGRTAEAEKPVDLPIAWNREVRKAVVK